ncbi:macro domain-containing protein [Clostridium saudiense]|uniref:macro domain-containing protein n=1 Tax=Clostridium saudiense TaxID=1414720 RepID=UPI0018AB7E4A
MRSIAFCCISTGEFHFPNKDAANIAINTVESFSNKKENLEKIDRIIFNVFKVYDYEIYIYNYY